MNINKKIEKLPGNNRLTRKINEIIDYVNWWNGLRTSNGYIVIEGTRGPIIDSRPQQD